MTSIDTISECSICFDPIDYKNGVRDSTFSKGVVCDKCEVLFNDSEREILIHCFNVARGLFYNEINENKKVKDILFDVLEDIIIERKPEFTLQNIFNKIMIRAQDYGLNLNFRINITIQENQIRCTICNSQLESNDENLCQKCNRDFSNEEIEQMEYLFKKYGGFFHQYKDNLNKIKQIIQYHIDEVERIGDYSKMFEMNEISLHYALLHGISLNEFIKILKKTNKFRSSGRSSIA